MDTMSQVVLLVVIFVPTFGGLGAYSLYRGLEERNVRLALQQAGTAVEATAIGRRIESRTSFSKNGMKTHLQYFVTYRYATPRGSVSHEECVSPGAYHEQPEGTKVNITYLSSDPEVMRETSEIGNVTGSNIMRVMAYVMLAIAAVIAIGGGVAIVSLSVQKNQATQAANATATAISLAKQAELAALKPLITPKLTAWQAEKGIDVHKLNPFDPADARIKEVDYGYCTFENNFFAYVWTSVSITDKEWSAKGFGYYPDARVPFLCHPEHWIVWDNGDLGDGWHVMAAKYDLR